MGAFTLSMPGRISAKLHCAIQSKVYLTPARNHRLLRLRLSSYLTLVKGGLDLLLAENETQSYGEKHSQKPHNHHTELYPGGHWRCASSRNHKADERQNAVQDTERLFDSVFHPCAPLDGKPIVLLGIQVPKHLP